MIYLQNKGISHVGNNELKMKCCEVHNVGAGHNEMIINEKKTRSHFRDIKFISITLLAFSVPLSKREGER